MSVKAQAPEEDPETAARREAAEARADAGRIDETRDNLGLETRNILRQFGKSRAGSLASGGAGNNNNFGFPGSIPGLFGGFGGAGNNFGSLARF